jgi:hypothetical protein
MVAWLGFTAQFTATFTHNQLAKMERQWAILADSTTAMMQHANCPSKFWGHVMRTSAYLSNRLPLPAASGGSGGVPFYVLHGTQDELSHLKVFKCSAHLRLEINTEANFPPKHFVAYSSGNAMTVMTTCFSTCHC